MLRSPVFHLQGQIAGRIGDVASVAGEPLENGAEDQTIGRSQGYPAMTIQEVLGGGQSVQEHGQVLGEPIAARAKPRVPASLLWCFGVSSRRSRFREYEHLLLGC
jgi:hypothetical protein